MIFMHWILFIGFYFCEKYIYANGDEKEIKRDMYAALSYFWSFVDCLKIIENKSSEKRVYTPDVRLIIATRVMPRRRAWSHALTSVQYQDARVEARVLAAL